MRARAGQLRCPPSRRRLRRGHREPDTRIVTPFRLGWTPADGRKRTSPLRVDREKAGFDHIRGFRFGGMRSATAWMRHASRRRGPADSTRLQFGATDARERDRVIGR